jgi:hypothetical protein
MQLVTMIFATIAIEMQWSKMKTFLRKSKARTLDLLESAIATALDSVSITDISNWFKHCGCYKC